MRRRTPRGRPSVPGHRRSAQRTRRLAAGGVGAALVVSLWLVLASGPAVPLRVSVLDVGQGDAILVEAADGSRLLVDGGADPDLLVRRLDERIPIWDRRIDLVVLTHPHEDHAGGLAGLVPRYRVGRIAETGVTGEGAGVRELRNAADRLGIGRLRLNQGDAFRLGAGRVDVLWPPRDDVDATAPTTNREVNDTSLVLAVGLGSQRVLLMGDLEEDRDGQLLAAIGDTGRALGPAQGRPSRQRRGHQPGPAGSHPATRGRHQRRGRQRLRPPGSGAA